MSNRYRMKKTVNTKIADVLARSGEPMTTGEIAAAVKVDYPISSNLATLVDAHEVTKVAFGVYQIAKPPRANGKAGLTGTVSMAVRLESDDTGVSLIAGPERFRMGWNELLAVFRAKSSA